MRRRPHCLQKTVAAEWQIRLMFPLAAAQSFP